MMVKSLYEGDYNVMDEDQIVSVCCMLNSAVHLDGLIDG